MINTKKVLNSNSNYTFVISYDRPKDELYLISLTPRHAKFVKVLNSINTNVSLIYFSELAKSSSLYLMINKIVHQMYT